jgi:hypothetical protein
MSVAQRSTSPGNAVLSVAIPVVILMAKLMDVLMDILMGILMAVPVWLSSWPFLLLRVPTVVLMAGPKAVCVSRLF